MPRKSPSTAKGPAYTIDDLKRVAITAMFADNELFDMLVLKGGNALDLIHKLSARASIDLDFSMKHDLTDVADFCSRVERALKAAYAPLGLVVFDLKMHEKPEVVSPELADFWGGYGVEFKLVPREKFEQYQNDIDSLRKYAVALGQGTKFLIDISRYEYIDGKQERSFDGYRIYVYSPEMIVCEKLRALCQQMPEYSEIVKRGGRGGSARARDFVDIHVLMEKLKLDLQTDNNRHVLTEMFRAKRVPLPLLGRLGGYRDFHRAEFPSVVATVKPGVQLKDFDYYFDYTLGLIDKLKPLWNV